MGRADLLSYSSDKIVIKTQSNDKSFLFLSDNYYPGWQAYVDDRQTKIYRADYTFRSVIVPKGIHEVIFKYQPLSFYIGTALTLAGIIVLAIVSFRLSMRSNRLPSLFQERYWP